MCLCLCLHIFVLMVKWLVPCSVNQEVVGSNPQGRNMFWEFCTIWTLLSNSSIMIACTDHALSVGRWDCEGEYWLFAILCQCQQNEVAYGSFLAQGTASRPSLPPPSLPPRASVNTQRTFLPWWNMSKTSSFSFDRRLQWATSKSSVENYKAMSYAYAIGHSAL